jgi:hypothetical protein
MSAPPRRGHARGVTHHLPHLVMMLVPMAVFAGIFGVQWRLSSEERLPAGLWTMVGATVVSGSVHGAMTPHHAHEAALLGWAMALMCLAQLTWAVWLLFAPTARLVEIGVLGNLGIVMLWAWTRLVGIPFGIAGGLRQRIGPWDLTCTLLEVSSVLLGLAWLSGVRLAVPRLTRLMSSPST